MLSSVASMARRAQTGPGAASHPEAYLQAPCQRAFARLLWCSLWWRQPH